MEYNRLDLIWNNLTIQSSDNYVILDKISGTAYNSKITILIGTIGTGKSTLMNVLTGKLKDYHVSGNISIRNSNIDNTSKSFISLVDDTFNFYNLISVYDTIYLSVQLFNMEESKDYLEYLTSSIINLLDISYIKNTFLINLSQGEKKLVSIGVILSEDPSIILLDEPFDFLDKWHINKILKILVKLSKKSKTVFLTMNSLDKCILRYCDYIYIIGYKSFMFRGSYKEYLLFFKNINKDLNNQDYSQDDNQDLTKDLNKVFNKDLQDDNQDDYKNDNNKYFNKKDPDEIVSDLLNIDYTNNYNKIKDIQNIQYIKDKWFNNKYYNDINLNNTDILKRETSTNIIIINLLLKRLFVCFFRNKEYYISFFIQKFIFFLLSVLVYPFIGYSQDDIQTRIGLLGFLILNSIDRSMSIIQSSFVPYKLIINREISVGMYSSTEGYLSYYFYNFILIYISNILYIIPVYWITRINNNLYRFLLFLINHFFLVNFIVAYSLLIGIFSKSSKSAHVIGSVGLMICSAFSGIFVNINTIPSYTKWITWLSPVYYALEFSLQISLSNLKFKCNERSCFKNGKEVLEEIGMNRMNRFISLGIFVIYILLIILLGIILMRRCI